MAKTEPKRTGESLIQHKVHYLTSIFCWI